MTPQMRICNVSNLGLSDEQEESELDELHLGSFDSHTYTN